MKKIIVIELDYHAEVLRNLCLYLENSNFDIYIFTTKKIWNQVKIYNDYTPYNFHVFNKRTDENTKEFILKHKKLIDTTDLIFFNTIASNFQFFSSIKFKPLVIVRIHNLNAYFTPLKNYRPIFSIFFLWKDLSHILRKTLGELENYYRKKFLKKVDYFMFPNSEITNYAIEKRILPSDKIIKNPFPLVHFTESHVLEKVTKSETIRISVIGAVDQRRRDYLLLFEAIEHILPYLNRKIEIILLGSIKGKYGEKVIKLFTSIKDPKFNIKYFKEFVNQDTFEKCILKSHFFILPLRLKTRYTISTEYYGYTKISGNVSDIIKYGKPAILPSTYPLNHKLKNITSQYKDKDELSNIIIEWVNQQVYLNKNINESLKYYKMDLIRKEIHDTILNIID